jgi:hypothetical protein
MPKEPRTRRSSERNEKTVVIRDRRQVEELRRQMAQRQERVAQPISSSRSLALWVVVGAAAFLVGGLVALFATRDDSASGAQTDPAPSTAVPPRASPTASGEPPSVSIDELPIEHK